MRKKKERKEKKKRKYENREKTKNDEDREERRITTWKQMGGITRKGRVNRFENGSRKKNKDGEGQNLTNANLIFFFFTECQNILLPSKDFNLTSL